MGSHREIYGITPEEYDMYWQQKVIPQMRELLTNYGEIGMFWFDMWIHHSQTVVTKEQLLQLKGLIRELQPNCLINSRLGLSIEEDPDIDFKTLGDNQIGSKKENFLGNRLQLLPILGVFMLPIPNGNQLLLCSKTS